MITSITFKNFRRFSDLSLPLSRLTMLTGTNGVGKTSVLEGLYCLFSETKLDVAQLSRFNRTFNNAPIPFGVAPNYTYKYRLFWKECPFQEQKECSVEAQSDNGLNWLWTYNQVNVFDLDKQLTVSPPVGFPPIDTMTEFALWNWSRYGELIDQHTQQLSVVNDFFQRAQILLPGDSLCYCIQQAQSNSPESLGMCRYLDFSTLRVSPNELTLDSSKSLTKALQIINPRITDVRLTDKEGGLSVILDDQYSLSLGAIGNGAVTLASALLVILELVGKVKNLPPDTPAFILIDEMGAGVHYSIMLEVWDYISKFSEKNPNIQFVFTTHNDDCVRAFCEVFSGSSIAQIVRLHQTASDNRIIPTVYDNEKQFENIITGNWEVRG